MRQTNSITVRIKNLLNRQDKIGVETLSCEAFKAELKLAFDATDSSYLNLSAQDIINRNKHRT